MIQKGTQRVWEKYCAWLRTMQSIARLAGFLLRSQGYEVREATTRWRRFEMLKITIPI